MVVVGPWEWETESESLQQQYASHTRTQMHFLFYHIHVLVSESARISQAEQGTSTRHSFSEKCASVVKQLLSNAQLLKTSRIRSRIESMSIEPALILWKLPEQDHIFTLHLLDLFSYMVLGMVLCLRIRDKRKAGNKWITSSHIHARKFFSPIASNCIQIRPISKYWHKILIETCRN
jgi:hypothetical protein